MSESLAALSFAGQHLAELLEQVNPLDRWAANRFAVDVLRGLRRRSYSDATQIMDHALEALKPTAIDWEGLSAFVTALIAALQPMFTSCIAGNR